MTNSSQLTPTHTLDDNDNNNNNNVDEGFENDNISVTGSPALANSIAEDDDRHSPSPLATTGGNSNATGGSSGAFTSLIQCNTAQFKKGDLLSGFQSHIHPQPNHQHALNHALAAQLFLQSPLIPQPSQWLYSQLYNNYSDLPWFRNTLQSGNGANGFRLPATASGAGAANTGIDGLDESGHRHSLNLAKRAVTLISHNDDEMDHCLSPPVSSSKRTPSPDDDIEIVAASRKSSDHLGAIKTRSAKNVDVWRPY